jgi:hypothetical protein
VSFTRSRRVRALVAGLVATSALVLAVPAAMADSSTVPSGNSVTAPVAGPDQSPAPGTLVSATADSDTVMGPNGMLNTMVYMDQVNYRAESGDWQPIDNSLVPAGDQGFAYQNAANAYSASIPRNASDPVRFERDGQWVTFALDGAEAPVVVSDNAATFVDALPGTDVSYLSQTDGLQENLTVSSLGKARPSYAFAMQMSQGLIANANAEGSIDFTDADGQPVFSIPPLTCTTPPGRIPASRKRSRFPFSRTLIEQP